MKKICIVTTARSEYGLLRWVIDEVYKDNSLELQLIVTGSHLSPEQGMTIDAIVKDGYPISKKIEFLMSTASDSGIAKSMGICGLSFADAFAELRPDILVVLGDRYELLPICSTALLMNIPIAHISGGDITEGAIDNQIRNAVTMMSTYHFSGTEESAERIFRMTNSKNNVYITGETNLDNFRKLPKWDRTKLATSLNINKNKKWVLCTYHSETKLTIEENLKRVDNLLSFFEIHQELEIIVTKANSDLGGVEINEKFTRASKELSNVHLFNSLGQHRYISILSQIKFMIGNSSSGIFETPILRVPVINIGNRQKGRKTPNNIINVDGSLDSISNAFFTVESEEYKSSLESIVNPYGDGHASERIVQILKVL